MLAGYNFPGIYNKIVNKKDGVKWDKFMIYAYSNNKIYQVNI